MSLGKILVPKNLFGKFVCVPCANSNKKMASLCGRTVFRICRQSISRTAVARFSMKEIPDDLELATGLEKRLILRRLAGDNDPFGLQVEKHGGLSINDPHIVHSAFDSRIVGCICEDEGSTVNWMWLYKGKPRRCECGFWFKLAYKAPV